LVKIQHKNLRLTNNIKTGQTIVKDKAIVKIVANHHFRSF
jgi:hypothetical protein